jgi:pimeloyl-ACP methyl ester carboxylesterase
MSVSRLVTLGRWLGPWADATTAPPVALWDTRVGDTRVRLYGDESARSCLLIAPGLHYAGPDDPRLDRFCRILARGGHLVVAPFIRDYLALVPGARAITDFAAVFDALPRLRTADRHARKPIVFSISFGSLLAFALAAERGSELERLVVFGGYADFHETMRFCLTGRVESGRHAARDPLNQAVVMLNLLDHVPHAREHRAALEAGWRAYVERTWGRPEMKARERFTVVAAEVAASVPEPVRELFLVGVGAHDGAWALAEPALRACDARTLDPSPYLPRVTGNVELVHGADDDVIPFEQSHALAAALVHARVRTHITGLYGHTGASFGKLAALPRELATMLRVLRAMS